MKLSQKKQKILSEFVKKNSKNRAITSRELLDLARPKRSAIHSFFEWDDDKAAESWRLEQARDYIACLFVVVNETPTREYVNLKINNQNKYVHIDRVRSNESLLDQAISSALVDLLHWKQRYETYLEFKGIVREIDKTDAKLRKKNGNKKDKTGRSNKNTTNKSKGGKDNNRGNKPSFGEQVL